MVQATTPTSVGSKYEANTSPTTIDVTWTWSAPTPGGNNAFNIQFVSKTNPADIFIATGPTGSSFNTTPTSSNAYSQTVTFTDAASAAKYSNYQAQVQAVGATPADNSAWGLQAYWVFGPSITLTIGSMELTLYQIPQTKVFVLPVSKANPLTITYTDIQKFATQFDSTLTFPQNWPNGAAITSTTSLNLSRFAIDATNGLLDLDVYINLAWPIFSGLTVNQIGLVLQRTNGTPITA